MSAAKKPKVVRAAKKPKKKAMATPSYRVPKNPHNAVVLPHGVALRMTTLPNGDASWQYTEEFVVEQFKNAAQAEEALANTLNSVAGKLPPNIQARRQGLCVTLTGITSREDFSDMIISEFMIWGGRLGTTTISQLFGAMVRLKMNAPISTSPKKH